MESISHHLMSRLSCFSYLIHRIVPHLTIKEVLHLPIEEDEVHLEVCYLASFETNLIYIFQMDHCFCRMDHLKALHHPIKGGEVHLVVCHLADSETFKFYIY